jgi:hypothetical protein
MNLLYNRLFVKGPLTHDNFVLHYCSELYCLYSVGVNGLFEKNKQMPWGDIILMKSNMLKIKKLCTLSQLTILAMFKGFVS